MRNRISNVLWGVFFIFIGVGIAGHVFDWWTFNPFFRGWWTLFIIIPCAISMIRDGFGTGSTTGFIIGVLLLVSQNVNLSFSVWKLIIPALLIFIGLKIIFQGSFQRRIHIEDNTNYNGQQAYTASSDSADHSAIFSSNRVHISDQFTGTSLNAIFGGVVLDLRDANILSGAVINATAIFGGIDIYIPRGIQVKVSSVPIFGGVSNKTGYQYDPNAPVIYLNATCMFGGIDIK